MGKKKVNANRIPVKWNEDDLYPEMEAITHDMVRLAWALVLSALGDRVDTTADSLLAFWKTVNVSASKLSTYEEIGSRLIMLDKRVGIMFPFRRISAANIRTKADLERLRRKLRENALHAMFALIADTIVERNVMDDETLRWLFTKVRSREEDIANKGLSERDLLNVLEDEFSLLLREKDSDVVLEKITGVLRENGCTEALD